MTRPQAKQRRSPVRRTRTARQLGLEALEDRNLLSAAPPIDLTGLALNPSQYSTTDILVQFKPSALVGGKAPVIDGTSAQALPLVTGLYDVQLPAGMTVANALAAYQADPAVSVVEPDFSIGSSSVPNNPMFSQQQYLLNTGQNGGTPGDDIGATHAWTVTTGSSSTVVAIMDTGIDYDQQDLYENIWINQAEIPKSRLAPSLGGTNPNGIQDYYHDGYVSWRDLNDPRNIGPGKITDVNHDGIIDAADILAPMVLNARGQDTGDGGWAYPGNTQDGDTAHPNDFIGWNFSANNNNPLDQNGHGTHVSGIIGAMGNSGVGIAGINWQVSLMDVQFMNSSGSGTIADFIDALNYAVQHGAKISNNSWSGADNDPLLIDAIANAQSHGMIFVAAAGNSSANNDVNPAYPSSFNLSNIVSVAAVDNNDQLASFSNYGAKSVDLAAPGVNILSTLPNNQYGTLSGTSMAAPMVTGVLALVWSEHPSWTYTQVIDQVLDTVDPIPGLQGKVLTGGVLDAARAVGYAPPVASPPSTLQVVSSTASISNSNSLSSILLTFNTAIDPSRFTNSNVALIGPNGQRIMVQSFQAVAGSSNQVNLFFPTQTAPGTYYLYVGAGIESTSGAALASTYQNSFVLPAPQTPATSTSQFQSTAPVGVPDVSQITTSLSVPSNLIITKLTVTLNMTSSIDGKIVLTLIAPDGTKVLLSNLEGGNGSSFTSTVFDDQAKTSIKSGQAPFTGSFQPEAALSGLAGKNARGTWQLNIVDHGTNYHVVLNSWTLTITGSSGTTTIAEFVSVPPDGNSVGMAPASTDSVFALPAAASVTAVRFASGAAAEALTLQKALNGSGPAQPAATDSSSPQSITHTIDAVFAALDGADRLAEIRAMMPHGNSTVDDSFDTAYDDSGDDVDTVDAVAMALLDS